MYTSIISRDEIEESRVQAWPLCAQQHLPFQCEQE